MNTKTVESFSALYDTCSKGCYKFIKLFVFYVRFIAVRVTNSDPNFILMIHLFNCQYSIKDLSYFSKGTNLYQTDDISLISRKSFKERLANFHNIIT